MKCEHWLGECEHNADPYEGCDDEEMMRACGRHSCGECCGPSVNVDVSECGGDTTKCILERVREEERAAWSRRMVQAHSLRSEK